MWFLYGFQAHARTHNIMKRRRKKQFRFHKIVVGDDHHHHQHEIHTNGLTKIHVNAYIAQCIHTVSLNTYLRVLCITFTKIFAVHKCAWILIHRKKIVIDDFGTNNEHMFSAHWLWKSIANKEANISLVQVNVNPDRSLFSTS